MRNREPTDPLLLVEVVLALGLLALFIALFWVPAASQPFRPHWWAWLAVAGALFLLLALDARRRRRSSRRALEEALRRAEQEDGPPPATRP